MKYVYTLIRPDGSSKEIGSYKKELNFQDCVRDGKKVEGMYKVLDCRTIELIPRDYYPESDAKNENVTYFGDEEGRFVAHPEQNRHMKVIIDNRGNIWDVVGSVVREEKVSERASKS